MKDQIFAEIKSLMPEMIKTLSELCAIPAISPLAGGDGEHRKGEYIIRKLKELGFGEPEMYNSPDETAMGGARPNIVVRVPGRTQQRLCIVSHMDVVPEGDRTLWHTDPFRAVVKDGRIYGRGVNDNCQELVASLYAAAALKRLGITPKYGVCLCFVADEEVGSLHGIQFLLTQHVFKPDDLVIVPDGGSESGDFIETAEKSILWAEFTLDGRQVHASTPQLGINACRTANEFSVALDSALHEAFPEEDRLFDPPVSTFEPTRRAQNVANVNTVPGREVFCFDCRVLPTIPLDKVRAVIDAVIKKTQDKYKVTITYKLLQNVQAPKPTPADSPVVDVLKTALKEVLPVEPKVGGVGGGTCAAYFRDKGIPAIVWDQEADCAHMPNEYAELAHIENEAKVFALMMAG